MVIWSKDLSLLGFFGAGRLPALRIAVPARGMDFKTKKPAPAIVSREEILALFGDRLKPAVADGLTERERAEKHLQARLRSAIYS
ncbi:MAG: hypothetical protein WCC57_14140 [Paracoccaceae bacterium]